MSTPASPWPVAHRRWHRVAASEHDLLTLARALVGLLGPEAVAPLLRRSRTLPAGVGPTCHALLTEVLGRGAVLSVLRRGGWRDDASFGEGGQVRRGRLWQRHEPPALRFGAATMRLLRHLAGEVVGQGKGKTLRIPKRTPIELGDELMLYLACDLLRRADTAAGVGRWPALRQSALCWLGHADVLVEDGQGELAEPPDQAVLRAAFAERWVVGPGAIIVEALAPDLARRWLEMERDKGRLGASTLSARGRAQDVVLGAFVAAAEERGRSDLLGFIGEAGAALLSPRPTAQSFISAAVDAPRRATLAERQAAAAGAGALLRAFVGLAGRIDEARQVRFFEDEYDAAQLLLSRWELYGATHVEHAGVLLRELASLDVVTVAEQG